MNKIIQEFTRLTEEKEFWWQDDPRDFIKRFLDGESQMLPSELSEFGRAWTGADQEDIAQAKEHLRNLLSVLPQRNHGELIFIMGYLKQKENSAHVTLLGPAIFPSDEALQSFISSLKENSIGEKLHLRLGAPVALKSDREGFAVESTTVGELHVALLAAARIHGAVFPEEHFTGSSYFPHVTDHGFGLESGDEFTVDRLSISLHPGARINIPHAYEIASLRLQ